MADDLEEVRQRFEADMAEYLDDIKRGADDAVLFADANRVAAGAVDAMRDHAAEAGAALGDLRDHTEAAKEADNGLRDSALEAGAALGHMRDEALLAAEAEKKLDDQNSSLGSRLDGLKSKLSGLFGGGGSGGGILSSFGSLPSGAGIGELLSNPYSLAAIAAGGQALLVELTGVVSGFAAAGAGAGAFALLAKPAVTQVMNAYTGLNTAVTAYQAAQAKEAMSPSKANAAAVKAALTNVNLAGQAIQQMPVSEQKAIDGLERLTAQFHAASKAFEPEAFKVFDDALKIANELLPTVTPWATTFADALDGLLKKGAAFAGSAGFRDWLAQFHKLEGPSVTAIGEGIGKVAVAIGKLLTIMSAKDVVNSINIAFTVLAWAVTGIGLAVRFAMLQWDMLTSAVDHGRADVEAAGHGIASAFDVARHGVATAGHDIAHAFDTVRHDASVAGHDIEQVGHDIVAGLGAAAAWISAHWKQIAAWLVSPVGMAVFEIRTHTHEIAKAFDTTRHDVAATIGGMRHDLATTFDQVRHDVSALADDVPHLIAHGFDLARHDAASAAASARHDVAATWDSMRHDAAHLTDDVVSFFRSLPGRILGQLAGLPGQMRASGYNIITGLINGIVSAAAAIPGIMSGLAHDVESYFTNPLKLFSPSRVFFDHGVNTVQGYINGVRAMASQARAAMQQIGGQVAAGGIGLGGPASIAGAPSVHVTVPISLGAGTQGYSSPQFLQYIQAAVQEAVLRYTGVNPTNGLSLAGKL